MDGQVEVLKTSTCFKSLLHVSLGQKALLTVVISPSFNIHTYIHIFTFSIYTQCVYHDHLKNKNWN